MTNILVTGANGQLGNEFRKLSGMCNDLEFIFTDIDELDITDKTGLYHFIQIHPVRFIINCAAYTAVDRAEEEPEKAFLLNSNSVGLLANICLKQDIQLIHFSTDYVFDGTLRRPYKEEDDPGPVSVYGKSKLDGELHLIKLKTGIIIRTSWLYSAFGHNFVKTILRSGRERNTLNVVSDQTGSPTWAHDLAGTVLRMIDRLKNRKKGTTSGIYHYSNEGSCSWYEFAKEILTIACITAEIRPVDTKAYPLKALRPSYSVLDTSKIKADMGIKIPCWKDSLKKCMKEIII